MQNKETKCLKKVYRIYNMSKNMHGEAFVMCDPCYEKWIAELKQQMDLSVEQIGDNSPLPCNECGC